ncbi:hypothetical protein PAAG_04349 [Paracoccidioides lutzii Pb01]|uniref:Protein kinase domain-containing protein n=1 Tax=Paracoccidioides lutzii (strain ATCC MYA-826 / Pb01) TaxID=502779 RepID=C1H0Q5_PARBA|nr:hypothetical protein PAAG_04349 [Paracoccidioides lutzii Pb01]EEH33299.2 hypothetical protein PAAG_04349 [Paracoccidioides lutzii Pb01]
MSALFQLGQILRGQIGSYTIIKRLQESVWLATSQSKQTVIVKSVCHFRLQNERDVLKSFQSRSPFVRPLIDEIADPSDPPAIVLKYAADHLLNASVSRKLTSPEIKYVARRILEAFRMLHEDGFVHTVLKPIAHFSHGGYAKDGDLIGAPIWRSPEPQLQIGWGTPTDIWSFGSLIITLVYGDNFFLFEPDVPAGHEDYELRILTRQCQFFGPFPVTYQGISSLETLAILTYIMRSLPPEKYKPFKRITEKEVSKVDRDFILKIMKLDPRDRPSARELLEDEWFNIET